MPWKNSPLLRTSRVCSQASFFQSARSVEHNGTLLEKGSGRNSCGSTTHTSSKRLAALSNCCMVAHMWATFIRHLLADLQERGEVVKVKEERTLTCKHTKNVSSDFISCLEVEYGTSSDWLISTQVWNLPHWIFAPVKIGCSLIIGNSLQSDDIIILVCVCVCVWGGGVRARTCVCTSSKSSNSFS